MFNYIVIQLCPAVPKTFLPACVKEYVKLRFFLKWIYSKSGQFPLLKKYLHLNVEVQWYKGNFFVLCVNAPHAVLADGVPQW